MIVVPVHAQRHRRSFALQKNGIFKKLHARKRAKSRIGIIAPPPARAVTKRFGKGSSFRRADRNLQRHGRIGAERRAVIHQKGVFFDARILIVEHRKRTGLRLFLLCSKRCQSVLRAVSFRRKLRRLQIAKERINAPLRAGKGKNIRDAAVCDIHIADRFKKNALAVAAVFHQTCSARQCNTRDRPPQKLHHHGTRRGISRFERKTEHIDKLSVVFLGKLIHPADVLRHLRGVYQRKC